MRPNNPHNPEASRKPRKAPENGERAEEEDVETFSLERRLVKLLTGKKPAARAKETTTRTNAVRGTIGGLIGLVGVGGIGAGIDAIENASEKSAEKSEVFQDALDLPLLEAREHAPILDAAFTTEMKKIEIENFLAETTGYTAPEGELLLDAEKTYTIYGDQLGAYIDNKLLVTVIASQTSKSQNRVRLGKRIVRKTLVKIPAGGQGLVKVEFVDSGNLRGHYSHEQIRDGYDNIYANQQTLIDLAMEASNFESLTPDEKADAIKSMTHIAQEMVDMGSLAMDIGRLAASSSTGAGVETTLFDGTDSRMHQWEKEMTEFEETWQAFIDLVNPENHSGEEFTKAMNQLQTSHNDHVRDLLTRSGYKNQLN